MKPEMLEKMDMPKKKKSEVDSAELDQELGDMGEEGLDSDMDAEAGEEMPMSDEADMGAVGSGILADVSDDDLIAEVKARGLKV